MADAGGGRADQNLARTGFGDGDILDDQGLSHFA
jgi:hypothetical protein